MVFGLVFGQYFKKITKDFYNFKSEFIRSDLNPLAFGNCYKLFINYYFVDNQSFSSHRQPYGTIVPGRQDVDIRMCLVYEYFAISYIP